MSLYQRMYHLLFNQVTDAIAYLEHGDSEQAKQVLISAQQETEELYLCAEEE